MLISDVTDALSAQGWEPDEGSADSFFYIPETMGQSSWIEHISLNVDEVGAHIGIYTKLRIDPRALHVFGVLATRMWRVSYVPLYLLGGDNQVFLQVEPITIGMLTAEQYAQEVSTVVKQLVPAAETICSVLQGLDEHTDIEKMLVMLGFSLGNLGSTQAH